MVAMSEEMRTRWFMHHVLPHEPALRKWLGLRPGAVIDVDDVIQEAYAVLAGIDRFDAIHNPRAYLFQVAQSVVVRHIRRSRVVSILAAENLEGLAVPDAATSPEQTVIDRDELRRLGEAIGRMPRQMRQAFILRRVLGLQQREIARRMRLSESTVEKHIGKSIKFLIDWFSDGGSGPSQTSMVADPLGDLLHDRPRNQSKH